MPFYTRFWLLKHAIFYQKRTPNHHRGLILPQNTLKHVKISSPDRLIVAAMLPYPWPISAIPQPNPIPRVSQCIAHALGPTIESSNGLIGIEPELGRVVETQRRPLLLLPKLF